MPEEQLRKIFERLPIAERKMPALIIDGKVYTWEALWIEVRDNKPDKDKILKRIEAIVEAKKNGRN